MTLKKYGQLLYDLSVCITDMICFPLVISYFPGVPEKMESMTEYLDDAEFAALFGIDVSTLEENGRSDSCEWIMDTLSGWLVSAEVRLPQNVRFKDDGSLCGWSMGCAFGLLSSYADTLEQALDKIIQQAELRIHSEFNAARKDQGIPEQPFTADFGPDEDAEDTSDWVCRKCGCTDEAACPGGCSWVEKDLCSACVEPPETDQK
ncbi:MAG: hypothetical protein LBQ10_00045 [Desulfovibrio sp.]|nr:hypothetical protein [Desulfovibrio sp.]